LAAPWVVVWAASTVVALGIQLVVVKVDLLAASMVEMKVDYWVASWAAQWEFASVG